MKRSFLLLVAIGFFSLSAKFSQAQLPEGVTVTKIWDNAPHSAFTDLLFFKGKFYCSFREGSAHVFGEDGSVRILSSGDGKKWESVAHLKKQGFDLRDPKLSVTPSGQIMVIIGGSIYEGRTMKGRVPHVSFSDKKGKNFSQPEPVSLEEGARSWGDWIWRVTWHKGIGYGINYQIGPDERRGPTAMCLVSTTDGKHFSKVYDFSVNGFLNEATIRFGDKDSMYVMIRRELDDKMGMIAAAAAPYQQWSFYKMNYRLGGPNFLFDSKGKIIAGTRVHEPVEHTGILYQVDQGTFREVIKMPSSGDGGYPGLLLKGKYLYVAYYASHEGKTSIYFSRIPLALFKS